MTSDAPPFHPAELALQERFGRRRMLEKPARRSIRDHLNQQHRDFFPQLPTSNPHREDGESYGADVSHRGGRPGFVRTDDAVTLTVPDYIGNSLFNTIGNLQVNPRAGLLFPNFVTGDILMLATRATVIWDDPEVREFAGAQRLLRFQIGCPNPSPSAATETSTTPPISPTPANGRTNLTNVRDGSYVKGLTIKPRLEAGANIQVLHGGS
jgi:predicted pyridoxine 5'-phosphate oxidase superfamily flavin-nucleotide-binding protein